MGAVQPRDECANVVFPSDAPDEPDPSRPARQRARAVQTHDPGTRQMPMQQLWASFGSGTYRIRSVEHTGERCFVTICRRPARRPLSTTTEWRVAERILCGEQPKVVADELSVSRSTVCGYWQTAVGSLCEPRCFSTALAFLVLCAGSTRGAFLEPATVHEVNSRGHALVSVRLDDSRLLSAGLSRAELHIARAVIAGKRASEICIERQTSPRTVANQLSAIYRKFRISGRRELVVAILVRSFALH